MGEMAVDLYVYKKKSNFLNWRLKPESNRRKRLCRPLHNHSAIQPYFLNVAIVYESPVCIVIIRAKNKKNGRAKTER